MTKLTPLRTLQWRARIGEHVTPLAAASGLVRVGSGWLVCADDELSLARFDAGDAQAPGESIALFPGALPAEPKARKARKPDLEALVALGDAQAARWILAVPSGSKPNRRLGGLVPVSVLDGRPIGPPRLVDLDPLYETLYAMTTDLLNIEGATLVGQQLWLFHRGLGGANPSRIFHIDTDGLLTSLQSGEAVSASRLHGASDVDLGTLAGAPLGFTDAFTLPDGRILFAAAAEDTKDPYLDGTVTGSAVGILTPTAALVSLTPLPGPWKIEGIHAASLSDGLHLTAVTDADDRTLASTMLTGMLSA